MKKKWIQIGQSKQEGEGDLKEKMRVIYLLKERYNLGGITDECVPMEHTGWYRMPDVWIKSEQVAIDLHGEVHGDGELELPDDRDRRLDYEHEGIKYIVIYKAQTWGYAEEELVRILDEHFGKA